MMSMKDLWTSFVEILIVLIMVLHVVLHEQVTELGGHLNEAAVH